jgi:hypothetical protein
MNNTLRRKAGASKAAAGALATKAVRPQGEGRKPGAAEKGRDHRFVMVKHVVEILADYDGLKGVMAKVISGDTGDGKVIVEIEAEHCYNRSGKRREILLCRGEWRLVIGGDYIAHGSAGEHAEASRLIQRYSNLVCWEMEGTAPETVERHQAATRRREKLRHRLLELQRRHAETQVWQWARHGLKSVGCTSLVLWTGKEVAA